MITKAMFIEIMNTIITLHREEEKFNSVLSEIDEEFGGCFIHNKSINVLVKILRDLTNDENDNIGYWLWELEFGEKYTEGCITEADGTPIPLKTIEDLWNLLKNDTKL